MESFEEIRLPWVGWKIVRYIGGGGYGKVYEIERNMAGIQEKAAVKIVSRPQDENELNDYYDNGYDVDSAKSSFESELQSYAKEYQLMKELQGQSNIVSCDDFAVVQNANGIGGQIFFRMELLTSLQQVLRVRTLSENEVIKLGRDISRALILCENKNIIHRDIKPQNILLSQFGDYKLGDFGVSKVMDHATFATSQGTIGFQAPEVVHIEKYGHRADIYSLGVTMYWLLNNKKMPFVGADEKLTPMIKAEADKRRYSGEKLPAPKNGSAALKKIVLKACAYRPEERYTSAEELYKALEGLESNSKAKGGKTTKTKARTIVNGSGESEEDWNETNQTVGAYKNSTTASKATEDDFEAEQTGSADWGTTAGTIGAFGKSTKKQKSNTSEQEEDKTIGAKQAYQKQAKKQKVEQQKAEPKKVKEVKAQTTQKKKEGSTIGFRGIIAFLGFSAIGLMLDFGSFINYIKQYHSAQGVQRVNLEFIYGKSVIEVVMAVTIWVCLITLLVYCKVRSRKTGIAFIGMMLLFCVENVIELIYICIIFQRDEVGIDDIIMLGVLLFLCVLPIVKVKADLQNIDNKN